MINNLRAIRKHRNKTLREVANDVSISYQSISHYENGIRLPTIDVINKLSRYYRVDANLLFPNDVDPITSESFDDRKYDDEKFRSYYTPFKEIIVFSNIENHDFSMIAKNVVDQVYIYRFGVGTGRYFGWLVKNDDYEPLYTVNDILVFRNVSGAVDSFINKHNRVFLSIEKDLSNRLYRVSFNSDVYFTDLITNEVFDKSTFDKSKLVGQLIELHRRIEF